jgi:toxoflavin biosynthesis protein ToxD
MTPPSTVLAVVGNPNQLTDRAAMGLPDSLVERLPADLFRTHAGLLRDDPWHLAQVCADPGQPFEQRYAAGSVLALAGDPRIRAAEPEMVEVPGGQVELGLRAELVDNVVARWGHAGVMADWIRKECPAHLVDVPAFRIMRYPVTNQEYLDFLRSSGVAALPSSWKFGAYPVQWANHPVWTLRPRDADAYSAWLSARTGRRFRLPSEAEWEYAASGGTGREYPWGDEFQPDRANTVEAGPLTTTPVGIYPAGRTVFGCDDMAGNVEEFVADDYAPYPGGVRIDDDLSPAGKPYQVTRGGSFTRFGDLARCRRRHGWFPRQLYAVGFRLAETA